MFLLKFINIPVFVISLIFGLVAVYMLNEGEMRKIYVYPTPENLEKIQYKDGTDTCYEFEQIEIQCPNNKNQISKIPIQA
uniref:Uncharacterized protein n=1 Tax=viral metagenome TaxID=1070528 RepID=A0A6C0IGB5_9ZZZZ